MDTELNAFVPLVLTYLFLKGAVFQIFSLSDPEISLSIVNLL